MAILDAYGKPFTDFLSRGEVIPHVATFGAIWNNLNKIYSYRWDEALRQLPENALAMRRDCYIRSLLQERAMPTVNRKWQIVGEDTKDPVQKATARALEASFRRIPRLKIMLMYLLQAQWYGRYGAQTVWRQRNVESMPRWCVVRHLPVNGDKIQYRQDGMPAVFINNTIRDRYPAELVQNTDRNPALLLAKPEWRRQFIFHKHEIDDADYFEGEMAGSVEGVGLRSMVYWGMWLRDEMLSWAVDFMKKVGSCGFWVFPFAEGSTAGEEAAKRNARNAGHEQAIIMPVVQAAGRSAKDSMPMHVAGDTSGIESLQEMISNYFERHIERLVIGQSMSSGGRKDSGGGMDDTGKADMAKDTKFQLLHYDADNLAETLTEDLVAPSMYFNFPQFDFPMRWEFVVDDPDKKEKTEFIKTFAPMGMTFVMDEVRELSGMSTPDEGEEVFPAIAGPGDQVKVPGQTVDGFDEDNPADMDWHGDDPDAPEERAPAPTPGKNGKPKPPPTPAAAPPQRFARRDVAEFYAADEGRWITIGGGKGEDGKKHGGSPVFIKNGRIEKGHPGLAGKTIANLKDKTPAAATPRDTSGTKRQQGGRKAAETARDAKSNREYTIAKHLKAARQEGIKPEHLHALASDVHAHANAHVETHNEILSHARSIAAKKGGSLQGLSTRNAGGKIDASSIPHFDKTAEETASYFPGHFGDDPQAELWDRLIEGNRAEYPQEEAYRQALDTLLEDKHNAAQSAHVTADDHIPFQRNGEPATYADQGHKPPGPGGGQFTPGGGGSHEMTDEEAEHSDRWYKEDERRNDKRDTHDTRTDRTRTKAETSLQRTRGQEDRQHGEKYKAENDRHKRLGAKITEQRDKRYDEAPDVDSANAVYDQHEAIHGRNDSQRDARHEALDAEESARETGREGEDKQRDESHAAEDAAETSRRDKEDHGIYHARKAQSPGAHAGHYTPAEHAKYSGPEPAEHYDALHKPAGPGGGQFTGPGGGGGGGKPKEDKPNAAESAEPGGFEEIAKQLPAAEHEKARSFFTRISDIVKGVSMDLLIKLHGAAPDILDSASDYSKIFYSSGKGTADPASAHLGIGANAVCVIASHVLSRAATLVRKKLGNKAASTYAEAPNHAEAVVSVFQTLADEIEGLAVPSVEDVEKWLAERETERA